MEVQMTDTVIDTEEVEEAEKARVIQVEAALEAQGLPTSEPVPEDYFGFEEIHRVALPDGISWVEHKTLNEGQRRKFLNDTNRGVRIKKASGDAEMNFAPGTEKAALLGVAIVNWNLYRKGATVSFTKNELDKFLQMAPPRIVDIIHKDIVKKNSWLMTEMSVEDIDKEIESLHELRAVKVAEEEGKDVSSGT
jgi:hypothetical protein